MHPLFSRFSPRLSKRVLSYSFAVVLITFGYVLTATPSVSASARYPAAYQQQASFTLDGVAVTIMSPFIPGRFVVSTSDNMTQMASSVSRNPYREFQIEAIPFTTRASEEALPMARSGEEALYRSMLHAYRASHGARLVTNSPTITLFGKRVRGETHMVRLPLDSLQSKTAVMAEYVVEAGKRLWLVRITQEQTTSDTTPNVSSIAFLHMLNSVRISSVTLSAPSTHIAALVHDAHASHPLPRGWSQAAKKVSNRDLPFPGWWSGVCDYNNYLNGTGWQSWQMNGGLDGVYPCGPRPGFGGPDYSVRFYSGAWPVLEWECVELAMRWMYLAYGVQPYSGNGNQVVSNYSTSYGGNMVNYVNSTACCIVPEPGDVLSYCSTCTYGHTSVAISTSVDGNGNGSVTVMEQNVVHNGLETLTVSNWQVQNTPEGWVYAYLHHT